MSGEAIAVTRHSEMHGVGLRYRLPHRHQLKKKHKRHQAIAARYSDDFCAYSVGNRPGNVVQALVITGLNRQCY